MLLYIYLNYSTGLGLSHTLAPNCTQSLTPRRRLTPSTPIPDTPLPPPPLFATTLPPPSPTASYVFLARKLPLSGSNHLDLSLPSLGEYRLRQTAAKRGEGRATREHECRQAEPRVDAGRICCVRAAGGVVHIIAALTVKRLPRILPSSAPGSASAHLAAAAGPAPRGGLARRAQSAEWARRGVGRTG